MLEIVLRTCSFCRERNIDGVLDLSQRGIQQDFGKHSVLAMLAHYMFFDENEERKARIRNYRGPGIRLVIGAKAIFICYDCLKKAADMAEDAVIT